MFKIVFSVFKHYYAEDTKIYDLFHAKHWTGFFCTLMNLPPPMARKNYNIIAGQVNKAVKSVAISSMSDAASEIFSRAEGDVVDTSISCDGTWQKRGFSSLNGAVVCISMITGRVLDVEAMSRYCKCCVSNENLKETDPEWCEDFKANHNCKLNHQGSAPSMEMNGTKKIFERSIEKNHLRYTEFFGDGQQTFFDNSRYVSKFKSCKARVHRTRPKTCR